MALFLKFVGLAVSNKHAVLIEYLQNESNHAILQELFHVREAFTNSIIVFGKTLVNLRCLFVQTLPHAVRCFRERFTQKFPDPVLGMAQ